jgi:hypothetical protein
MYEECPWKYKLRYRDKIKRDIEGVEGFMGTWCEYPDLCRLRKHFVKVEALPANGYLNEPGVALVNKYVALKNEAKEIDQEMGKVKEAMLDYARREEIELMKGSDYKARVKFDEKLKFPSKNDAKRQELDKAIKEAGKWAEVSQLDISSLTHVVESRRWSRDLIEQVMKYGRIEQTASVTVSKLKDEEK